MTKKEFTNAQRNSYLSLYVSGYHELALKNYKNFIRFFEYELEKERSHFDLPELFIQICEDIINLKDFGAKLLYKSFFFESLLTLKVLERFCDDTIFLKKMNTIRKSISKN